MFVSIVAGGGHISGYGVPSTNSPFVGAKVGKRLSERVDVLMEFTTTSSNAGTDDSVSSIFGLLGLRLRPFQSMFQRPRLNATALHLEACIGYGALERDTASESTSADAIVGGVAVGWMPLQGVDWSAGLEVWERLGWGRSGVMNTLLVLLTVQLHWGQTF